MDTFDNNDLIPEEETPLPIANDFNAYPAEEPVPEEPVSEPVYQPQPAPQPEPAVYRGTGTGRRESPYANSPYVMHNREQTQYEYRYQPQTQPPEKPQKPKAKKQRRPFWKGLVPAVLTVALVAGGCLITANTVNEYWEDRNERTVEQLNKQIDDLQDQIDAISRQTTGASVSGSPVAAGDSLTPSQVYAQNVQSVVAISSIIQSTGYYGTTEGSSSGSGFILSEDGYVLTNYHVVEGATSVSVIMHDGTEYPATVVGYDASTNDLAVLKVDATGLPAATIGSSDNLIIGDMVVAIGNPLGELTSTQTVGYVSGIGREVATDSLTTIRMIQTDAAINPGNSGGPLFNMKGEVIGITTAKYSGTTTSGASIEGIGFAIPIDDVMNVIDDLIDYGYVTGAYLGVSVQNTDESSAAMFGLPTGAYIVEVVKGYAADRAGIQPKDIIIDVGGYGVGNVTDLTRALRNFKAGDTTTITVIRSGAELTLNITLDEKPQDLNTTTPAAEPSMPSEGSYEDWYEYFRRYFGG